MRRLVQREGGDGPLRDWVAFTTPDLEKMVQRAVERVLKVLDLPRRSDIEALNENLDRVARAIEGLGHPTRADEEPEPPSAHPGD
jgi:hypothetical protein